MKLMAINRETEIEESKLFGEVYLPETWLEEDVFSPFEFFLCQLDLASFDFEFMPKRGYLYFFIEATSLTEKKLKPVVRYFDGEPDAYTDFNDGFFDEEPKTFALVSESIGTLNIDCECGNQVCLLEITSALLPFEISTKKMKFLANKNDIDKNDYSKTSLVFVN